MPAPVLAAPLVIPFAEAIGVSIAALGMAKATDKVNEFIQENPEQSIKIFQMIMPSQGIANALKNKSSEGDEEVSEDIDVEVEEKPKKLTGKEKSERIKAAIRRARAGKGNYSSPDAEGPAVDIGGSVIREVEDMGIADKDLKDNYDPTKPKFDYKKFFKKRYADGGSIGIEVLFGPKVPAAPSQLVSESDILLGYRGDAGYRSGSEQSKSIGQGNVGSKASFGGGQGTDRSGRSEGAGGADRSRITQQQTRNQNANNFLNKIKKANPPGNSPFQKFLAHDRFTDLLKESKIPNYHQLGGFDFMARFPDINPDVAKGLASAYQNIFEYGRAIADGPGGITFEDAGKKADEESRLNAVGIDAFSDPNSETYKTYSEGLIPEIMGNVKMADGGAIGIEVLFGPKRDNFRYGGDTMGGKNDKSKSSPGPDSSKVSAQQQSNHEQAMAAAQNDGPSFKDKVKSVITNPATQALGGAILTGGINLAIPGALDKLNKARVIKNAIDYARYVAPNEAIEGELENIQTQGGIVPYADGGRVGFFMGGPPLEGQALSIYNSMNAYGFDDKAIADALLAQGLYTAGGTTDTPDTTIQPIGFQSSNGGGGGGITELNPLNRPKGTPFDLNSLTKTKFGYNNALGRTIEGVKDFTGSMIDKFSGSKIGEGITSGATKFKNMAFTPMMALMQKRNPLNPSATNYNPNLQKQMDFLEGTTGTRVFGTSDNLQFEDAAMIGRDPNSGLAKYGPGSVLSGQNVVSGFGTNDYEQQIANYVEKIRNRAITKTLTKFQQQKLDAAMAELGREKARQEKDAADRARAANADVYAELDKKTGGKGYGDAGGFSTSKAGKEGAFGTFGEGRGRKDFSEGGLVTMFKEKR
jgi:hypothetical protein